MKRGPKKGILRAFAAGAAALFALSLTSCGEEQKATRGLFAMDTYMSITAYGAGDGALDGAAELIGRLDGLLNVNGRESEIAALNASNGEMTVVSAETFDVISRSLELSRELGGDFQLTLRPVSEAWGFTSGEYRVPEEAELASLLKLVDDGAVELDEAGLTVTLPEGAKLDLGSTAKGYAADAAAAELKAAGVEAALLDLGSSTILAFGTKPDGSAWKIALREPNDPSAFAGTIEIPEGAVSTSGGYERAFTGDDGQLYWHILDPETGRPARTGIGSVSVLTEDALLGDALSTALFVMGPEAAERLRISRGDFEYVLLMEDGSTLLSPGMEGLFTPMGARAAGA